MHHEHLGLGPGSVHQELRHAALGDVATTRLDDETTEKLLDLEDELLEDAASMSPEKFWRACRDRIHRLERDKGIERNQRQRNDTYLSRKHNVATGMIEELRHVIPELNAVYEDLTADLYGETLGPDDPRLGRMVKILLGYKEAELL